MTSTVQAEEPMTVKGDGTPNVQTAGGFVHNREVKMLQGLLNTVLYPLKACVMFNTAHSSGELLKTGFSTDKDALIGLVLLLIAAALFGSVLVFYEDLQVAYGSVLTIFLPVALLDQLGMMYFKRRLQYVHETYSSEERMEYMA